MRNEYIVQDNGYDYTTFDCTPPSVEVGFEKPEVVVRDFVIDQTSPIEEILVESEKDGFDYRYTVGLDRISVNVLSPDPDTNHERTQTATKQWLHSDRLGSTVNSTDSFGRVTERTDYNEWGEITFHEKIQNVLGYRTINTDQTYTNHDYDVVLGLYYAKARMYDAGDKRFVQIDPIWDGLNWYTYCYNMPTVLVDYFGLSATDLNPTDKINNMSTQYDYYKVRDIFGDAGQVGGTINTSRAPIYTCQVQYGGKMLSVEYNLSEFTGKRGTYTGQATVKMYENIYSTTSIQSKTLGNVAIKYNGSSFTTSIELAGLKNTLIRSGVSLIVQRKKIMQN